VNIKALSGLDSFLASVCRRRAALAFFVHALYRESITVLAEHYLLIKATHVGLALLSGALFAGRGVGVLLGSALPLSVGMRRLSQGVDTALLVAALLLLWVLGLSPLATPWLLLKLVLLVAYVVLGTLALRRAPTPRGKVLAFLAALCCFAAMVATARSKDPLWIPRLLGLA
jgi:uncharacterized membrane protein SirB2